MDKISVLDHGYLGLVERWGSEEQIIEAARMSTNKGFLGWGARCKKCKRPLGGDSNWQICPNEDCEDAGVEPGDEKLLKFLYDNKHSTPFEMGGLTLEVQAPIFVFREWHRHRVPFGYNEMSSRYTPLPDVNYIPSVERIMLNAATAKGNKQAGTVSGSAMITAEAADKFRHNLAQIYAASEALYQQALKDGVPKELARVHLPVGRYSRMRATGNLRGWLAFLTLRMAGGAQWEIRQYANEIAKIVKQEFPQVWELFAATMGHEGI